ncbi:MAG: hypothetical protein IKQ23_06450, partial [Treponema sp.]|nr:hypothetical protein [Treponema sp.]
MKTEWFWRALRQAQEPISVTIKTEDFMNYRNAQDIFPENLLKQIQRYVSGETIYIPAKNEKKAWGESSGYRAYLAKRNQSMKKDFADGLTIEQLAEKYYLSFDSVKHIVYTKQERTMLQFSKTLSSAMT